MILIIGLLLAGVLLIAAEVFLPSGLIATAGAIFLVSGIVLAFSNYDVFGGLLAAVGAGVATAAVVILELRLLPRTRIGRRMFNQAASDGRAVDTGAATAPELIGKAGRAATAFAPTGIVEIDGKQYEASSIDGFLQRGDALVVAGRDTYKLLVKKAPA